MGQSPQNLHANLPSEQGEVVGDMLVRGKDVT